MKDPRFAPTQHWLLLENMVKANGWEIGAELGILKGRTFFHLLDSCPDLRLIGVDQWEHLAESKEDGAEHYKEHDFASLPDQIRARARMYGTRASVLHMSTESAANYVPKDSLDFVFIDAGHTEAACRADIETWAPRVKESGWIAGHDWNWPSVRRAIDDLLPGWRMHAHNVWTIPRAECRF